ncbi:MAG: hydrolase [Microbacteriaceae bacterium]|nr:hydrolase [Microbacteriaceae bacterium]
MTDAPLIGPVEAPGLHVMSFNIRRRLPHLNPNNPDRWERRRPLLKRILEDEHPALVGVQEALPDMAGFVRHSLGKSYGSVGYGRQRDRKGEGCPIFFDRDRLKLLRWTQTALSATPLVQASATWGNRVPRVVVNAAFEDRATGRRFRAINTHFDHQSRNARLLAAGVVNGLAAASVLPSVVMGDFNTDAGTGPHNVLVGAGELVDTWDAADRRLTEVWGTFLDYKPPVHDRKRIDWILVSPSVEILEVGINVTCYDEGWPSDHAPVQAVLRFR